MHARRTWQETGYGYVMRSDEVLVDTHGGTAFRATRFHESPDADFVAEYLASRLFLMERRHIHLAT